jgi:hypothetical protein
MDYRGEQSELISTGGDARRFGPWTLVVTGGGPTPAWHATITMAEVDALADLVGTTVRGRFHCDDRPTIIEGMLRITPMVITTGDGRHLHELAGGGDLQWLEKRS